MTSACYSLKDAVLPDGFCAFELAVPIERARAIHAIGTTDLLALERGTSSVVHIFDSDDDGIPDTKRKLAGAPYINHGLAIHNNYIYASRDSTVYRWSYENDSFDNIGEVETVIVNINEDGDGGAPQGHTTRTLVFDGQGRFYVSVGSNVNVDPDSHRSRIRRFPALEESSLPLDFQAAEVFADGLRNEVGLSFDRHGVLWGVENGADDLRRDDLGGSIFQNNPAEELNRFREEDAGKHWGYPFCWTEFLLDDDHAMGRGTAWVWPSFLGEYTDEQCRADFVPSIVSMQAHSAPLGITFYAWKSPETMSSKCPDMAFPKEMDGYAFIAHHGSWNRDIPTGYKVVYVPMDENGDATGEPIDLLAHAPPNAQWGDGFRPVDVSFDECGRLLVSSDGTRGAGSKIVRIEYNGNSGTESPSASPSMITAAAVVPVDDFNNNSNVLTQCKSCELNPPKSDGRSSRVQKRAILVVATMLAFMWHQL